MPSQLSPTSACFWPPGGGNVRLPAAGNLPSNTVGGAGDVHAGVAVQTLLSVVSVPVVPCVVVPGLTRPLWELTGEGGSGTSRRILNRFLGVVADLIRNHTYESHPRNAALLPALGFPVDADLRRRLRSVL